MIYLNDAEYVASIKKEVDDWENNKSRKILSSLCKNIVIT